MGLNGKYVLSQVGAAELGKPRLFKWPRKVQSSP